MKKYFLIITILLFVQFVNAQRIQILTDSSSVSLRGLSVVNDAILWVSGSKGTVGKSIDGGKTWKWITVKGFESTDFRDVEAFSSKEAIIMGVGEPAYILRTVDGGQNWHVVFDDKTKGMFLDAMEFWDSKNGIVIGDPINQRFFMARTSDGGKTWKPLSEKNKSVAENGEYFFASSGTNIRRFNKLESVFVTGGLTSHLFIGDRKLKLPILQGRESTGANSIGVKNRKTMVVVGGDYTRKNDTLQNCVMTYDGGMTWVSPEKSPTGYRSCVEYLQKNKWITCGLNGVDISNDNGRNWVTISPDSFHVCRKAKKGKAVYFAGNNGRIGKLLN
ncbi:MAG: YCF48-related protein [Ginsengibacter sp.]